MGAVAELPFVGSREHGLTLVQAVETEDRATVLKVMAIRIAAAIDDRDTRGPALAALCRHLRTIIQELDVAS